MFHLQLRRQSLECFQPVALAADGVVDLVIIQLRNSSDDDLMIFVFVQLTHAEHQQVVFAQTQFGADVALLVPAVEPVGVDADAVDVFHLRTVEGLGPGLVLPVDGDDDVAVPGHEPLHRVEDQPMGQAGSLEEVEAVTHINNLGTGPAELLRRQPGDHAHDGLVGPYNIVVMFRQQPLHVAVAPDIVGGHGTAFQADNVDGLDIVFQRMAHLVHAAAHIGAGDLHVVSMLAEVLHMGHQELDHHEIRGGDEQLLHASSFAMRSAIFSAVRP